jgi:Transposase DDE domain
MRVSGIVRRICGGCVALVHAARLAALVAVVEGVTRANRLSVTAVGRMVRSRACPKHSIKRVDRLLSNPRLQAERWLVFESIARQLIGDVARPVILMDWTPVVEGFSALVAAVPVGGRALTIYEEVHPERQNNKPRVQARFLRSLRDILPPRCRPIIVVDAGFKGPFFREVQRLGWDFVGRERQHVCLKLPDGSWTVTESLFATATAEPKDLGIATLNKTPASSISVRLVVVASPRKPGHPWRHRLPGGGKERRKYRRGAHEPWLLPTSLHDADPARIVALYATRMQIEETFRDAKNPRFGWCLRHARGYSAQRLTMLLMIAALAALVVTLIGLAAEQHGRQRAYQANTVRTRVLSHFVLGIALLRRSDRFPLGDVFATGIRHFRAVLRTYQPQGTSCAP